MRASGMRRRAKKRKGIAVRETNPTYGQIEEGAWEELPRDREYHMACCDCGLVHRMEARTRGGKVEFRVFRLQRETAQIRRHNKIKISPRPAVFEPGK